MCLNPLKVLVVWITRICGGSSAKPTGLLALSQVS